MYKELLPKYDQVQQFVEHYRPQSVFDYGCARGNLITRLKQDYSFIKTLSGYDPGNPDYCNAPTKVYESLVSCDVIEHFEPDQLDQTLKFMQTLFSRSAYLLIACYPAKKFLADGRNAHLIIETPDWWFDRVTKQFDQCRVVKRQDYMFPSKRGPQPEIRLTLEKL